MVTPAKFTSIDNKLGTIFHRAVVFCLLVTSVGFAVTFLYYSAQSFRQELSSVANVVAATSRAALLFDDPKTGQRVLSSLIAKPSIRYAGLFNQKGQLVSEYGKLELNLPNRVQREFNSVYWTSSSAELSVPVMLDNDVIGRLVIVSSLDTLYEQLEVLLVIAFSITLFAAVGALYFRSILRRMVSAPIVSLRDAAKRVALTNDFSTRIDGNLQADDEIGQLVATFNQMLGQLEERERALVFAKNKAEEADRLKSIFLATVSHELRTPLHAILGMTEEVLQSSLSEDQRDLLDVVRSSGTLLISIINDILDFSKLEAGKLSLVPVVIELPDLLANLVKFFGLSARKKGIALSVHLDPNVPTTLSVDGGRLTQVLVNLVANAMRFTHEGGISICVKKSKSISQRGHLGIAFSVIDTGIGIPTEALTSIFESFTQVRQAGTPIEGTGLGLAISSRLVALMGGSIWAESKVGRGSTFHFTIAAQVIEEKPRILSAPLLPETTGSVESTKIAVETRASFSKPYVILVVEDNKVNSKLAHRVLSKAGYTVKLAFDGVECLEVMAREHIDLVLMDLNMPVMDGITATRRIREQERKNGGCTSIIALTANALDDQAAQCIEAGMNEFLTKPLDRETLLSAIARYLRPTSHSQPTVPVRIADSDWGNDSGGS